MVNIFFPLDEAFCLCKIGCLISAAAWNSLDFTSNYQPNLYIEAALGSPLEQFYINTTVPRRVYNEEKNETRTQLGEHPGRHKSRGVCLSRWRGGLGIGLRHFWEGYPRQIDIRNAGSER